MCAAPNCSLREKSVSLAKEPVLIADGGPLKEI